MTRRTAAAVRAEQHQREVEADIAPSQARLARLFGNITCANIVNEPAVCVVQLEFDDNTHYHRAKCSCGWRGLRVAIGKHETARIEGVRHVATHDVFEPHVHVSGVDKNRGGR